MNIKTNESKNNYKINTRQLIELEDGEIVSNSSQNELKTKEKIKIKVKNLRQQRRKSSSSSSSSFSVLKPKHNINKSFKNQNYKTEKSRSTGFLCQNFLKNRCNLGKKCNLSHDLKNYPCYLQNLFGQCTQESCQFDHSRNQSTSTLIRIFEDNQQKVFELLNSGKALKCPKSVQKWIQESLTKNRMAIVLDDSPIHNQQPPQPVLIPQNICMPRYLQENDEPLKQFQKIIDSRDPTDSAIKYMVDKYKDLLQKELSQMLCPLEAIRFIRECVINREVSSPQLEKLLLSEQKKIPIIKILKILNLNTYKATMSMNEKLQRDLYSQASQEGEETQNLIGTYIPIQTSQKVENKQQIQQQTQIVPLQYKFDELRSSLQLEQNYEVLSQRKILMQYQKILDSDPKTYPPAQFIVDNLKDKIQQEISLLSNPLRNINFFQECLRNRKINEQELESLLISEQNKIPIIKILRIINMNPILILKQFDQELLEQLYQQALQEEELNGKDLIGIYIPIIIQQNIEKEPFNYVVDEIGQQQEKQIKYHSLQNLQTGQVQVMTEDLKSQFRMMMKNRKRPENLQK